MTLADNSRRSLRLGCHLTALALAMFAGGLGYGCGDDANDSDGDKAAAAGSAGDAPMTAPPHDAGSAGTSAPATAGRSAPAPLDGGRDFGDRPDVAFGVARPTGPLSKARVLGIVLDLGGQPIKGAAISAGGAAVISDNGGYFKLGEVYGEAATDVFATALGFASGHVRVPLRGAEPSYAILTLASATRVAVDDLAAAFTPELEDGIAIEVPAEAFVTLWDETISGPGSLYYAWLGQRGAVGAAPGGLLARMADGSLIRLRSRALFELQAAQGGNQLELNAPVPVVVTPEVGMLGSDEQLYWFDPAAGAFVARGEFEVTGDDLKATIDRLGFWAVGTTDTSARTACRRVRVQDADGAAVPYAALRIDDTTFYDSVHLTVDERGEVCLDQARTATLEAIAFGATAAGFSLATAMLPVIPEPAVASCGAGPESCSELSLITVQPLPQTCVRGVLATTFVGTVDYGVTGKDEGMLRVGSLPKPGPFCIGVPRGTTLAFGSVAGQCGAPHVLPDAPGFCGESDCLDLGTVTCCYPSDVCDNGMDDDCDAMVDEGCSCAGATCYSLDENRCCTATPACGAHSPRDGTCVATDQPGRPDATCPDEPLPDSSSELSASGCCRTDNRCGVLWNSFGCVPREELSALWELELSLAPVACTY